MKRRSFFHVLGLAGSVYASGKLLGSLSYQQIRQKLAKSKIYIVPYAHSDWAWVHTRQWQADRDNLIFNEVLDILRDNPKYRWFLDTQNEELQTFLDRTPDRVHELKTRVREGSIGISGGTICNPHPHWMEGESFVWNLVLGRQYFEKNFPGAKLNAMTLYDICVGYTQVPQILTKTGYKYYRFWRPGGALNAKGIPRQFRWKGLDTSEIICSRGTYGGLTSKWEIPDNIDNWEQSVKHFYDRVLSKIMNVETSGFVWIANGSDDARPLRVYFPVDPSEPRLKVPEFIQEWNRREKIPMRFATPIEFFEDLERQKDRLPVVDGVLDPIGWTYWYGINGVHGLRMWRTLADDKLVSAQKYMALSTQFGEPYPEEEFARLWRDLLTTCSHAQNWLFEEDYQQQIDLVRSVVARASALETEGLQRLAGRVKVRDSSVALVVFNPFPWQRNDVVKLHPTFDISNTEDVEVRDTQGRVVPSQIEQIDYYDDEPFVKEGDVWAQIEVPPMGYTTVYLARKPRSAGSQIPGPSKNKMTVGPAEFHLQVDSEGVPTLVDSSLGVSYSHAGEIIYQEVHDVGPLHYGPITGEQHLQNPKMTLLEIGPVRWVGTIAGSIGPHKLHLQAAVYPSRRRVEYCAKIESQGGNGYFLATVTPPFTGDISAGVPFGVEPRNLKAEPYEGIERLRRNVFYAGHWVDISDGRQGLTFIGRKGEKGYTYEPETRRLGHYLLQTIQHVPKGWEQFCNHYMEGKGRQVFTYYFISHADAWKEANIPRAALEAEYGLCAVSRNRRVPSSELMLSESRAFLTCPDHVFLSSLSRSGNRSVLRIYEGLGQAGEVQIRLPQEFTSAREIDLNGHPRSKSITIQRDLVSFKIRPWEIVTLELT